MKSWIKAHPLIAFYLLAFAISWLGWGTQAAYARGWFPFDSFLFTLLGGTGPTLAAVMVLMLTEGKDSPRELFRALVQWAGAGWLAVALLSPLVLALVAWALEPLLGGPQLALAAMPWGAMLAFLPLMLLSNVWEELGWRGYALPRLQQRYSALGTSVLMGLLWSLWHLPLMLNPDAAMATLPLWAEPIFAISLSIIYTWLYNHTAGSLLYVTLFHAASNAVAFALFDVHPDFARHYVLMVGVTAAAAAALVVIFGPARLKRGTANK